MSEGNEQRSGEQLDHQEMTAWLVELVDLYEAALNKAIFRLKSGQPAEEILVTARGLGQRLRELAHAGHLKREERETFINESLEYRRMLGIAPTERGTGDG